MNREETARALEIHFRIDSHLTRMVWDKLEESNQEFFQNYYTRLALIQQIVRFNQLLEQQHQAMNSPPVPAEEQMSMEVSETAPQKNSPESEMNYENEVESDKLPATPVGSVGSEEVAGSTPHLVAGGSLARSSLEAQGMRINAALDAAHMPISQVPNLLQVATKLQTSGDLFNHQLMARSLSHLDIKAEASVQENLSNSASGQDSPSEDV
ncbi:uncharacterized protein LOC130137500 [Syzygium oleosum]|uniref:uncharacterized protein LOC130137500 n=1 Tax=Syzygium oleosum TaxID=219896 RepID=UPI0024B8A512|nr:uncharacterized protein LOC130137500 [Syzygium oleosum]